MRPTTRPDATAPLPGAPASSSARPHSGEPPERPLRTAYVEAGDGDGPCLAHFPVI